MTERYLSKRLKMVGYGRVSTDEEKQLDSLQNQIEFFTQFAESRNYQLIHVYADEGISGKQLKKRDEFMKMLSDAEIYQFDVVVVKDVSRFARNTVDLLTSIRKLKGMGVNVLFVNNNQQTMGESEFVITLLGAMAQEESANLSKRVKFGKAINAKKGRVPREILGYDKVDNYTLKVNEEGASLVRRIYTMYLSGDCGMAHIATILRGEQIRTPKGCAFTEGYIRRVLTNPIYCGTLVNHKTVTVDFINGKRVALAEDEQYFHDRPELAIVSKEDYDAVQRIREQRCMMQTANGKDPRRRYSSRYLFSGLVRCAQCGRTMIRQNNKRPNGVVDSYWRCPSGTGMKHDDHCENRVFIRDDELRSALSEMLDSIISDKQAFAALLKSAIETKANDTQRVEEETTSIEQRRIRLLKQKEKYVELCVNEAITMDELKQYTIKIIKQLEILENEARELEGKKNFSRRIRDSINACLEEINKFLALDDIKNSDLKRFLAQIEVGNDRQVTFVFRTDDIMNGDRL